MNFLGVPAWLFVLMMAASLITGLIIRFWLDRRKARQAHERAIRLKEEKKLAKRAQKRARKASKNRKNSTPPQAGKAAEVSSDQPDSDRTA